MFFIEEGERCLLEGEWLALVMAKDRNLHLKIDQVGSVIQTGVDRPKIIL